MVQAEKNRSTGSNACPSTTLSTTNPMWPGLGSNSGLYGKMPATTPADTRNNSRQLSFFRKKHADINVLLVSVCSTTLPVTVHILRWVMGWSVNDELERFWMETAIIRLLPEENDVSILSSFLSHPVRIRLRRVSTSLQFISVSVGVYQLVFTQEHAGTIQLLTRPKNANPEKPSFLILWNIYLRRLTL
jgi:hypothetical protein